MNRSLLMTALLGSFCFTHLALATAMQTLSCHDKHAKQSRPLTVEIQDAEVLPENLRDQAPKNVRVRMGSREHQLWFTHVSQQDFIVHTDDAGESALIYIPVQGLGKAGTLSNVRTSVTSQNGGSKGQYECTSSLSEAGQVAQPGVIPVSTH